MKQKIEYFLNAVFYINWKWLVKRQIYSIKACSFIIIKISSFLTTKKYHEKVIDRLRKNILEMEEYLNRVPNDLINIQAKLSWKLVIYLYCCSIFFPIMVKGAVYIHNNQLGDKSFIFLLIVILGLGVFLLMSCEEMVQNHYKKYFELFSKKDKAWHKKWRTIKIIFYILPVIICFLYVLIASGRINYDWRS